MFDYNQSSKLRKIFFFLTLAVLLAATIVFAGWFFQIKQVTDFSYGDNIQVGKIDHSSVKEASSVSLNISDGNEVGNSRLVISGSKIYLPSGEEFIPRGFSWGAWGTMQSGDAAHNVDEGANIVRIPLRWWGKYSDASIDSRDDNAGGHINPAHLTELDRMIKEASEAGLWINLFIDSDCGQNGLQLDVFGTGKYCDPEGKYGLSGHNFWTDLEERKKFFEVWQFIANRYKDTPYIGVYELLPEPNPLNSSAEEISTFYQDLAKVVNEIDPRTPILIGGRSYMVKSVESSYFSTDIPVVYTGNMFPHPAKGGEKEIIVDLTSRLKYLTDFRAKHNVPVYVQQTGVRYGDDDKQTITNAVLSLHNNNDVGFAWWEYRQQGNYANGYGVWYLKNDGTWAKKEYVLDVISKYLKE